jgi:hypothetical protein
MTQPRTASPLPKSSLRAPVLWGVAFGAIQAAAPLGVWWLAPATVYALSLVLIAAVYVGFAVADGRRSVIAVETAVAGGSWCSPRPASPDRRGCWCSALAAMGKDLWQHRRRYVANTRWWPPFCLVVDWVAAAVLVVLITVGVHFRP